MASVTTIHHPDGSVRCYRVRYRTAANQSRSTDVPAGPGQLKVARSLAADLERDRRRGRGLDRRGEDTTVAAWRREWQAAQVHAEGTVRRVNAALDPFERLVLPGAKACLGDRVLTSLRPIDVDNWKV